MRRRALATGVALLLAIVAGCSETKPIRVEIEGRPEAAADREQEAYAAKVRLRLDRLNVRLRRLEAAADAAESGLKASGKEALDVIRQGLETVEQRLRGLDSADGDDWQDARPEVDEAIGELEREVDQLSE